MMLKIRSMITSNLFSHKNKNNLLKNQIKMNWKIHKNKVDTRQLNKCKIMIITDLIKNKTLM